jgi:hypothetical protein
MLDLYAGPGDGQRRRRQLDAVAIALVAACGVDGDELARDWTAVYDLLLLGRIRPPEDIDAYDEPPAV